MVIQKQKYNYYKQLILWFPVVSILITIFLSLGIIYFTFNSYYQKEKEVVKSEFYKDLKIVTKQRVYTASKVLDEFYRSLILSEKGKLKDILNILINNNLDTSPPHIHIKISKKPIVFDKSKYLVVFEKRNGLYYYVYENKKFIKEKVKKEIPTLFDAFRWGKEGYIFVHDIKGVCYYHINKKLIGKNRWNLKRNGVYILQKLIKAALAHPNGTYVEYLAYNPNGGKPLKKISFIVYNKDLGLTIGSGVYLNELKKRLNNIENKKKKLLKILIYRILIFNVILFVIFGFISLLLAKAVFKRFQKYEEDLFILEIKQKEKECKDELTGLLNRKCLKKEFEKYKNQKIALIDINLNSFKNINEIYGKEIGDEVIKILAKKLKNVIKQKDILGKDKIDEFILLIKYNDKRDVHNLVKRIYNTLTRCIKIKSFEIYPSIRIGVAFNGIDSKDFDDLLNKAAMSSYNAKNSDIKIAYYNAEIDEKLKKYLEIKNDLLKIISNDNFSQFEIYYQPQIDKNEKLAGMEALIRWHHPKKGFISPSEFLPVAINEGYIKKIDLWTIETVIKQINEWLKKGYNPGVVSCNVTMPQLESRDFINKLKKLIKKHNLNTKYFGIEVTEESIMQNIDTVTDTLFKIKELGITISLDDFGTGYSNFMKLKTLPIDKLKIDKSFIDGIPNNKNNVALTKIIIQVGKILNLKLIAEGVETKEQRDFVFENGVDYIQGYFYSKPLPKDEIEKKYFI